MVIISPYDIDSVINDIKNDSGLMELWERYKDKNKYVGETSWNDVIESLVSLWLLFTVYEKGNKNDCLQALFDYLSHNTCEAGTQKA